MGIAYRSDVSTRLTVVVVDGSVTEAEFHAVARLQDDDPDWHVTTRLLTDARTAATLAPTEKQLSALAALYARMRGRDQPLRAAIVAGSDFGTAFHYGKLRSSGNATTIAFSFLETACSWLGINSQSASAMIAELRDDLGVVETRNDTST